MPHYRDPDGNRYFFDGVPEKGTVRPDLVLMADAEVVEADTPKPPPVPDAVERVQFRLALLQLGVTEAAVQTELGKLPVAQRARILIEWQHRPLIRKDSQWVQTLCTTFTLVPDDLFRLAATL